MILVLHLIQTRSFPLKEQIYNPSIVSRMLKLGMFMQSDSPAGLQCWLWHPGFRRPVILSSFLLDYDIINVKWPRNTLIRKSEKKIVGSYVLTFDMGTGEKIYRNTNSGLCRQHVHVTLFSRTEFLIYKWVTTIWANFWSFAPFWEEARRNLTQPSQEAEFSSFCSSSAPPNLPDLLTCRHGPLHSCCIFK